MSNHCRTNFSSIFSVQQFIPKAIQHNLIATNHTVVKTTPLTLSCLSLLSLLRIYMSEDFAASDKGRHNFLSQILEGV